MHHFAEKYKIARNITYTCLAIAAGSFILEYFFRTVTAIFIVFVAVIVGIPACLAFYYYKGMQNEDSDEELIGVETLEKTEEKEPDIGKELHLK